MKSTSKDTAREVLKELGISEPTKVQIDLLQNVLLDAYFEGKQEGFRWGTKLDEE